MASSIQDDEFDEYDKPGTERSRRRRGDEDLDSDLEGDLLEDDWLTTRKNASDASDEELNDDLLQSDEDDENISGQGASLSLNATSGLGSTFDLHEAPLEDPDYPEDHQDLGQEVYEGGEGAEGYTEEGYEDEYGEHDVGLAEDQAEYSAEQAEDDVYQDEVLDIGIDDPIDDEFQVDEYPTGYSHEPLEVQVNIQHVPESEEAAADSSQIMEPAEPSHIMEADEMENEAEQDEDLKEESDEEEDEDEESERLRFKSERTDVTVVRLADAASKRRNIPETLELSEEAKAHLQEFEEKERQRKQGRFGGRGGRGRGGRGGRPTFPGFGMTDFRGGRGGRMNAQRPLLMPLQMGMQSHPRMPSHPRRHPQQYQHPPRGVFHDQGPHRPPPQPLIPPHLSQRLGPIHTPPPRPQMDPNRLLSPPPPTHSSPQQPKNIHINPHFRGPAAPAQVPLMPAQNQPRPAAGPPRFAGPADFPQPPQPQPQQQQHIPGNYSQSPRPQHPEPWSGPPPALPQEREPFFIGEPRFPGQHMFDQHNSAQLMNNSHALHGQNPMAFNQSGPGFNPPGPQSMFQREPMRASVPPPGPMGIPSLGQHGPPAPRHFLPQRPQFPQPGPPLQHQPIPQFGMQGLMHPSPHQQHQEPHAPPQQQHPPPQRPHSLPLQPPLLQHHPHLHPAREPRPMMHQGQPLHTIPTQSHAHPRAHQQQHPQPRANPIRPRMNSPSPMLKPPMQRMQAPPQRNSNLRELPVAPAGATFSSPRPATMPAAQVRPTARFRPDARAQPAPKLLERTVVQKVKKEAPAPQPGLSQQPQAPPADPEEDEETRLYRLKIEEQKKLREEILKQKELRRQMQAGERKKELLERLTGQQQQQQTPVSPAPANGANIPPQPAPGPAPSPIPTLTSTPNPASGPTNPRPNVKTRLMMANVQGQGGIRQPVPNAQAQWQQKRPMNRLGPNRQGPQFQSPQGQGRPAVLTAVKEQGPQFQTPQGQGRPAVLTAVQEQGVEPKVAVKRTVMQRTNSGGSDSMQVPQKVRVVKLLSRGGEAADGTSAVPLQQQKIQQVPRQIQPIRQVPIRKVTMGSGPRPQLQTQKPNLQQLTPHSGRGGVGSPQQNRVVVHGRGRAAALQMGRGRGAASRQSQQQQHPGEAQPCIVSIEGLSSSTTDVQLKNLLKSIGPIQMFKMLPQQRKAIAKFIHPQHASSFQQSFHRHMIDLSHIDVSLVDG